MGTLSQAMRAAVCCVLFSLICLNEVSPVRILLFDAGFARSITMMSIRAAQSLAAQNHTVAVWSLRESLNEPPAVPRGVTLIDVPFDYGDAWRAILQDWAFEPQTALMMISVGLTFGESSWKSCLYQLEQFDALKGRLDDQAGSEPFDLAIYHAFDLCNVILTEKLKIPRRTFVATDTLVPEPAVHFQGLPSNPSYIPTTATGWADRMSYFERVQNTFSQMQMSLMFVPKLSYLTWEADLWQNLAPSETSFFDIITESTDGLLINGETILDFPRPLPLSSVFMGNLQAAKKQGNKKMDSFYEELCEKSNKGVIVVSFGSMVNASRIPRKMTMAMLEGLAQFPDYTVFWRFAAPFEAAAKYKNIHTVNWLPQRELLRHKKTKLFVTHGGYNSLLESSTAGVPMVFIPLFFDQVGNAMRAVRLGFGVTLEKSELSSETMSDAIRTVISDTRFATRAKQIASIFNDKLISPEIQLDHTIKSLAKRHRKQLQLFSRNLNFVKYLSLDVAAVFVLFFIIFK